MLKEMPSIILNEEQLSSYRKVKIEHEESEIYIDKAQTIKIFNNVELCEEREDIINVLYNYQIKGFCNPTTKVYNELNQFIGYAMPYLKKYKNLITKKLDINQKIKIAMDLISIFKEAIKLNVVYSDFNIDNILTNGEDAQYIDCDSVILTNDYIEEDLKYLINGCCKDLARLILSLILELDFDKLNAYNNRKTIMNFLQSLKDPYFLEIVGKIYTKDLTKTEEFYVDEQLVKMDLEKIIILSKNYTFDKNKIVY